MFRFNCFFFPKEKHEEILMKLLSFSIYFEEERLPYDLCKLVIRSGKVDHAHDLYNLNSFYLSPPPKKCIF